MHVLVEVRAPLPARESSAPVLTALPASRLDRRLAYAALTISALVFLLAAPFAQAPQTKVWAFIPSYESALVVTDLVTAALLAGQFLILRSRALRALLCGYAFNGLIAVVHMASFPGLYGAHGVIGGDDQTTAWLYMFWHGGFALCVLVYTRMQGAVDGPAGLALAKGMAWVVAAVLAAYVLTADLPLPNIMNGYHYTSAMNVVVATVWLLSVAAWFAVWRRRNTDVLDLWLSVVMCAWICDIGLSAVLNAGRFDLGFYLGRVFGLIAASFVLIVLLIEYGWLHARLVETTGELRRLSSSDALTGLANRRAFDLALREEWRRAIRHGSTLNLLMIDVDHFKLFNDHYGHVAGDECLRRVAAAVLRSAQRAGELAARFGGEEFCVLLPGTSQEDAAAAARSLSNAVAALRLEHMTSPTAAHVTVSIGVAPLSTSESTGEHESASILAFVEQADAALYAAKQAGRNRVHVYSKATIDTHAPMPTAPLSPHPTVSS